MQQSMDTELCLYTIRETPQSFYQPYMFFVCFFSTFRMDNGYNRSTTFFFPQTRRKIMYHYIKKNEMGTRTPVQQLTPTPIPKA
jgi:hypothetical protein